MLLFVQQKCRNYWDVFPLFQIIFSLIFYSKFSFLTITTFKIMVLCKDNCKPSELYTQWTHWWFCILNNRYVSYFSFIEKLLCTICNYINKQRKINATIKEEIKCIKYMYCIASQRCREYNHHIQKFSFLIHLFKIFIKS